MRGLSWKPETARPHLEEESATSGTWAVTHRWSNHVVPRTFTTGDSEDEHQGQIDTESDLFSHTTQIILHLVIHYCYLCYLLFTRGFLINTPSHHKRMIYLCVCICCTHRHTHAPPELSPPPVNPTSSSDRMTVFLQSFIHLCCVISGSAALIFVSTCTSQPFPLRRFVQAPVTIVLRLNLSVVTAEKPDTSSLDVCIMFICAVVAYPSLHLSTSFRLLLSVT